VLNGIVEGTTTAEVYTPAIEHAFVSRLDHAAYLGRELARAEEALRSGEPYVQGGAQERESLRTAGQCGCKSACQPEQAQ
jgi:tetrahydromethanopterin S-methyltransferase subunit A